MAQSVRYPSSIRAEKAYYQRNKAAVAKGAARWSQNNPRKRWAIVLRRKVGLSLVQFDDLLCSQAGHCAICSRPAGAKSMLEVDHCHASGLVRGLLCGPCNRAVGLLGDNPMRAIRTADYLGGRLVPFVTPDHTPTIRPVVAQRAGHDRRCKLTAVEVREIRRLAATGTRHCDIAVQFHVDRKS